MSETKNCQNCAQEFQVESEDFLFYEKMKVPPPTLCGHCRMVRRFSFRNEHILFRRKDSLTGKDIFSSFPPDVPLTVYERDFWWSDGWDPMATGREYDFSRSFFEQFRELLVEAPVFSRSVVSNVNSDYTDQSGWLKNCYLCFDADSAENSAYLVKVNDIKESFDLLECSLNELCYEDIITEESYRVFFSEDCVNVPMSGFQKI